MKIIIDMNLSPTWKKFLEDHDLEAKHWSEIGNANDTDSVILAWARQNQYIIFTNDFKNYFSTVELTYFTAPNSAWRKSTNCLAVRPERPLCLVAHCLARNSNSSSANSIFACWAK